MLVYFNGRYLQKSEVSISPDDRGFLFADGVYEVIRAYRGKLFKYAEHLDRLAFSLKELRISGCHPATLESVANRLLKENNLENSNAKVYVQITRGAAARAHKFPPAGTPPSVYVEATAFSSPRDLQEKGVAAITVSDERWGRCDIKSIGLLANVLANQQAIEAGADEAIFSRDGLLQEGTHSGILFVKDSVLIAPPMTRFILPSVTRSVVLSLARQESIPVAVGACLESELATFEEILMLGSGLEIVPITAVNGHKVGNGAPGPLTRRLQTAFQKLVTS